MTADVLSALEVVVVASVAITARSIGALDGDLTLLQWRVILILGEDDAGATVSEIAARIGANLSPTSRLIGRLGSRGLVGAARDAADHRATRVTLTAAGRELRSGVIATRRAELRRVLAESVLEREDVAALTRLARAFERHG